MIAARQVSPLLSDFAVATIRLPAPPARRRRTSNEPLGARVVRMLRKTVDPLRLIVTRQRLPTRFWSTSNSVSRRPLSRLTFSLEVEFMVQWPAARFVIGVLLAFLPAAVIGAFAYHYIKSYLFDVRVVCVSLIVGGFVLMWVDRLNLQARYHEATGFPLPMYLGIGFIQCISMIPGVSRAGATIVGAMLFGADRRSAADFSFWRAMPTMVGAFAYEVYKSRGDLALGGNIAVTVVGFLFSFIFGWIVVKTFLGYVQRHSFALFAWWRILVGSAGLLALYVL